MPACLKPGANSNVGNTETAQLRSSLASDYRGYLVDSRDTENNSSPTYNAARSQTAPQKSTAKFRELGSLPQVTWNISLWAIL